MEQNCRAFSQNYYDVGNGHQILDFIYKYSLGFSYGNAAKYMIRAGRKENNSADSDLNKALNYITSSHEEFSFLKRVLMRLWNTFTFNDSMVLHDKELAAILKSIIKFDKPENIAHLIVIYASERGIDVKPEYKCYAD